VHIPRYTEVVPGAVNGIGSLLTFTTPHRQTHAIKGVHQVRALHPGAYLATEDDKTPGMADCALSDQFAKSRERARDPDRLLSGASQGLSTCRAALPFSVGSYGQRA
jgi:hypothetical protein